MIFTGKHHKKNSKISSSQDLGDDGLHSLLPSPLPPSFEMTVSSSRSYVVSSPSDISFEDPFDDPSMEPIPLPFPQSVQARTAHDASNLLPVPDDASRSSSFMQLQYKPLDTKLPQESGSGHTVGSNISTNEPVFGDDQPPMLKKSQGTIPMQTNQSLFMIPFGDRNAEPLPVGSQGQVPQPLVHPTSVDSAFLNEYSSKKGPTGIRHAVGCKRSTTEALFADDQVSANKRQRSALGPPCEPTAGPKSVPTSELTSGPTSGPTFGATLSPKSSPTSGPTLDPATGPRYGPTVLVEAATSDEEAKTRFRPYQEKNWREQFQKLIQYKQNNGHCCVPLTYTEDAILGRWVKRQRHQYKKFNDSDPTSTMTTRRIKDLKSIGFVWAPHQSTWLEKLNELKAFRKRTGHCNVPARYPENTTLATWVKCQRRQHKLFVSGDSSSTMTIERFQKLHSLDFVFDTSRKKSLVR
ncbi:unnamed protein product [Cylindrotheca closterium]|uniref:Helicase-associated domain-containing protein n=1 Tax=Cylindrotheca closterium TaxID=2856 RepID=A0AAD2CIZ1_9STRA|nr:unnamed protein product [Cylindrotheca closterium]